MFQMTTEDRDVEECGVCQEEYEEDGERVPRFLPCHHTYCERCLTDLMKNNSIQCPKCRAQHKVRNGVKSFVQNMYILSNLKKKRAKCEAHQRDLNMFCETKGCEKSICLKCLSDHRGHEVVDLEEVAAKRGREIKANILSMRGLLQRYKNCLECSSSARLDKSNDSAIHQATTVKKIVLKQISDAFDVVIADMNLSSAKSKTAFIEEVTSTNAWINQIERELSEIEGKARGRLNLDDFKNDEEAVCAIRRKISLHLGTIKWKELRYKRGTALFGIGTLSVAPDTLKSLVGRSETVEGPPVSPKDVFLQPKKSGQNQNAQAGATTAPTGSSTVQAIPLVRIVESCPSPLGGPQTAAAASGSGVAQPFAAAASITPEKRSGIKDVSNLSDQAKAKSARRTSGAGTPSKVNEPTPGSSKRRVPLTPQPCKKMKSSFSGE